MGKKTGALSLLLALSCVASVARAEITVYEKKNAEDPDDTQSLRFYGFLQPRFTYQQKDTRDPNNTVDNPPGFSFKRARLGTIARVDRYVLFQTELEVSSASVLGVDAFVRLMPRPELQLTLGQFRVPFSRQNLIQGFTQQTPDGSYWQSSTFLMDRDVGGQLGGETLDGRISYALAMMNGNGPRVARNPDDHFLFAARLELAPLGRFPRYEGDLRPLEERVNPLFYLAGGAMHNQVSDIRYKRTYLGADASFLWRGLSVYGEFYQRKDDPEDQAARDAGVQVVTARGFNVEAGYFVPVGYAEEHLQLVGRVQQLDPNREVKYPTPRDDLTTTNPSQGFRGYGVGLNWYLRGTHFAKLQAFYEFRNELKKCLTGQIQVGAADPEAGCTGFVKNDVLTIQATAAF
jgi:hypothetical protein